jgi:hypothetical protein
MRIRFRFATLVSLAIIAQVFSGRAFAQQAADSRPLMLVTWFGPGAIALPSGSDWKPELFTAYDKRHASGGTVQ